MQSILIVVIDLHAWIKIRREQQYPDNVIDLPLYLDLRLKNVQLLLNL